MLNIIKSHHKLIRNFTHPILPPIQFSTQKHHQNKPPPSNQKQIHLINKRLQSQISTLNNSIKRFTNQYNEQIQIAKNCKLNYVVLVARSILIANKSLEVDLAYALIKKIIRKNTGGLTPFSCTALMQCLNYFKFDGDQQNILQQLCQFYEKNYVLFTSSQQKQFWLNYMQIMSKKVHTSLTFINLIRKKKQTFQYAPINQIIAKWMKYTNINSKIVKNINLQYEDQTIITINSINNKNFDVVIKFKQLVNIKEICWNQQKEFDSFLDDNRKKQKFAINNIRFVNKIMKNGWNVVIHGKLYTPCQSEQQLIHENINLTNLQKNTSQANNTHQINEDILNNPQNRQSLLQSHHYCNGFYYDSITINNRMIDLIPTLILGIDKKIRKISQIRFVQSNNKKFIGQCLINYISLSQLKECLGYAKICQNHWKLFQSFCQIQKYLRFVTFQQQQQKYKLKQIKTAVQKGELTKSQANAILSSRSQMMTQMTLKSLNSIQNLIFQQKYNDEYKKINSLLGNIGDEEFWQMRPFFQDTMRIMETVEKIGEKAKQSGKKNVKIVIMTNKHHIPYIFQNIVQGKYYTTSKQNPNEQQNKQKQKILKQLYSSISQISS